MRSRLSQARSATSQGQCHRGFQPKQGENPWTRWGLAKQVPSLGVCFQLPDEKKAKGEGQELPGRSPLGRWKWIDWTWELPERVVKSISGPPGETRSCA